MNLAIFQSFSVTICSPLTTLQHLTFILLYTLNISGQYYFEWHCFAINQQWLQASLKSLYTNYFSMHRLNDQHIVFSIIFILLLNIYQYIFSILYYNKKISPQMSQTSYKKQRVTSLMTNQHLSYLLSFTAPFFWVCGNIYPNQHNIDPIQTNYIRFLVQFITVFALCIYSKQPLLYKNQHQFRIMCLRGLLSVVNGFVTSIVQFYLPVSIIQTIGSTAIIFVFILNYLLYKVQIERKHIFTIIAAFVGILLTVNGRLLYSFIDPNYVFQSSFQNYKTDDVVVITAVAFAFLVWMIIWAYSMIITSKTNSSFNQFLLLNAFIGFVILSTVYCSLEKRSNWDELLPLILWSGLVFTISTYIYNLGLFISENTGLTGMVNQFIVVVGYGVSVIRYGEKINAFCLIGSFLIIGSIYFILIK